MKTHRILILVTFLLACTALTAPSTAAEAPRRKDRGIGMPFHTMETAHFRITYHGNLQGIAKEVGTILEELYETYVGIYHLSLPGKTEVLVSNDDQNVNNWALTILNTISIAANDMGYNLRGSKNYLRDAVAHEFAHIASIWTSFKLPAWMPYIQGGYFSHPNDFNAGIGAGVRTEAFHVYPAEILPPWFFEGITQYQSTQMGGDAWDTHRDMIMRTLTLSNRLLSWDHMSVFAGKGDDFEKTYNHGFSMMRYIAATYGYEKVPAMLRESTKFFRVNFDRSVRAVLGVSGRQLYADWKKTLEVRYKRQLDSLGTQVYGRKLNKDGFDNYWPRFSPNGSKLYFLSNGKNDYAWSLMGLYSYSLVDTVKEDKRIRKEPLGVGDFYSIHRQSGRIVYSSMKSPKSGVSFDQGGGRRRDLFIDTLPPDKPKFSLLPKKTERQVTEKRGLFAAAFSPSGDRIAAAWHNVDRFHLCLLDTAGANYRVVYPDTADTQNSIQTIYSVDWSPDGRSIAFSFVHRRGDRKIAIYDTLTKQTSLLCDTRFDERDPRFTPDGKALLFASDRTGIYNIYRYDFAAGGVDRLTNVAGGAFAPDLSADGRRLAYVNYDKDGYGIYLIDSVRTVGRCAADSSCLTAAAAPPPRTAAFTKPVRYSRLPRQFICVPTILWEQVLTDENNAFAGATTFKAGAVVNLIDPVAWIHRGNELGAYFLFEPSKLLRLFSLDDFPFNPQVNYDLGVFGVTRLLPVDLSLEYNQRNIAGTDLYWDDYQGVLRSFDYSLVPRNALFSASYGFEERFNIPVSIHGLAGYNWFDVIIDDNLFPFDYTPAQGARFGAALSHAAPARDSRSLISPRGLYAKIKYEFWYQNLINEEKPFLSDKGWVAENYDDYRYNQVTASLKMGMPMPWSPKQALYGELWGTGLALTSACRADLRDNPDLETDRLPSYFQPVGWLPGYVYYYRDTVSIRNRYDTTGTATIDKALDTVLLSGDAVAQVKLSYRFPLWPRSIDKKLGFLYLDLLYGAVNVNMGRAWGAPMQIIDNIRSLGDEGRFADLFRDEWLKSAGAEVRLETVSFGTFPLAFYTRWDWGFDRAAPIGGHKFTVGLGFSFDNWEYIDLPDYGMRGGAPGR